MIISPGFVLPFENKLQKRKMKIKTKKIKNNKEQCGWFVCFVVFLFLCVCFFFGKRQWALCVIAVNATTQLSSVGDGSISANKKSCSRINRFYNSRRPRHWHMSRSDVVITMSSYLNVWNTFDFSWVLFGDLSGHQFQFNRNVMILLIH